MADTPTPDGLTAPRKRRARPAATPAATDTAIVDQASLASLTADRAEVSQGAIAHAQVQDLTVRQGAVALVESSAHVRLEQSAVGAVMGDEVEISTGSLALVVVAGEVHGDVRPIVDWRGALALGLGLGLVRLLLGGRGRRRG